MSCVLYPPSTLSGRKNRLDVWLLHASRHRPTSPTLLAGCRTGLHLARSTSSSSVRSFSFLRWGRDTRRDNSSLIDCLRRTRSQGQSARADAAAMAANIRSPLLSRFPEYSPRPDPLHVSEPLPLAGREDSPLPSRLTSSLTSEGGETKVLGRFDRHFRSRRFGFRRTWRDHGGVWRASERRGREEKDGRRGREASGDVCGARRRGMGEERRRRSSQVLWTCSATSCHREAAPETCEGEFADEEAPRGRTGLPQGARARKGMSRSDGPAGQGQERNGKDRRGPPRHLRSHEKAARKPRGQTGGSTGEEGDRTKGQKGNPDARSQARWKSRTRSGPGSMRNHEEDP
eukprot:scaffold5_cov331-Pavlova_lutheri.AAC.30